MALIFNGHAFKSVSSAEFQLERYNMTRDLIWVMKGKVGGNWKKYNGMCKMACSRRKGKILQYCTIVKDGSCQERGQKQSCQK